MDSIHDELADPIGYRPVIFGSGLFGPFYITVRDLCVNAFHWSKLSADLCDSGVEWVNTRTPVEINPPGFSENGLRRPYHLSVSKNEWTSA